MLCKECGCELRIAKSETQVFGDASPNTQTRVLLMQSLICTNVQCAMHKKEVCKSETQIFPE
ncbi:MAG: hypothetical protein RR271_07035 [Oscillospiraceae bacterium]